MRRYVVRAEPVCRRSNESVRQLALNLPQATASQEEPGGSIVSGLIKPGIAILEERAARLRELDPPDSTQLRVYVGLYDPIVELSRQLLPTAEAADANRSHELERLIAGLGHEQSEIAKDLGFRACAIGFTESLGGQG